MTHLAHRLAVSFTYSTALLHVFCCGIPFMMSIGTLAALLGMTGVEMLPIAWFEAVELQVLMVSGGLLLATGVLQYVSNRINCRTDGQCAHEPCDDKKTLSQKLFYGAVVLFLMNVVFYVGWHDVVHVHGG